MTIHIHCSEKNNLSKSQQNNTIKNQPTSFSILKTNPTQDGSSISEVTGNASSRDENSFINSVNIDLLYDELTLSDFNEHVKTIVGMLLTMDMAQKTETTKYLMEFMMINSIITTRKKVELRSYWGYKHG